MSLIQDRGRQYLVRSRSRVQLVEPVLVPASAIWLSGSIQPVFFFSCMSNNCALCIRSLPCSHWRSSASLPPVYRVQAERLGARPHAPSHPAAWPVHDLRRRSGLFTVAGLVCLAGTSSSVLTYAQRVISSTIRETSNRAKAYVCTILLSCCQVVLCLVTTVANVKVGVGRNLRI